MSLPLSRLLTDRIDARPAAIVRIIIGAVAVLAAWESWRALSRLLAPDIVDLPYLIDLPRLPAAGLPAFISFWLIAAAAFIVGFGTRIAGTALTAVVTYTLLLDQQMYSNHLYLLALSLLLVTIADSAAVWSLDARWRGPRSSVPAWPLWLLKVQASLVYVFAGLAKITGSYLSGEVLTRSLVTDGLLVFPLTWRAPVVLGGIAVVSIAAELFIGIGLWSPRLTRVAVAMGIGLHACMVGLLDSSRLSLGIFAIDMFAIYVLFMAESTAVARIAPAAQRS